VTDFIVTADGKWIPGYAFIYICRAIPGIVKFQVIQERDGRIDVLLVTDERFSAEGIECVRRAVRQRLRSDDSVSVRAVDDIAPAPSGKYRPAIGRLAQDLRARFHQA